MTAFPPATGYRPQAAWFAAAGGLATAIHWAAMGLLVATGADPLLSTAVGSLAGASANYGLQRGLAFRGAGPHRQTVWRYLIACAFAWQANLLLFAVLNGAAALPVAIAQALTTALVAVSNFAIYRRLVFHEHRR